MFVNGENNEHFEFLEGDMEIDPRMTHYLCRPVVHLERDAFYTENRRRTSISTTSIDKMTE